MSMTSLLTAGVQAPLTGRAMEVGAKEMIIEKPQGQISVGIMRVA